MVTALLIIVIGLFYTVARGREAGMNCADAAGGLQCDVALSEQRKCAGAQ